MARSQGLQEATVALTPGFMVKRKRRTPASAPPPRKRSRNGDTRSACAIRQQTLTQAQWVSSTPASFADEADLKPLEAMPRRAPARRVVKRDSTLTQMPFFDQPLSQREETDFGLLPLPEDEAKSPPPIPQGDAAYFSPRKPRKRKPSITIATDADTKRAHPTQGSREYRPSSRKSNESAIKEAPHPRRTSKRIAQRATILSDRAENIDYFEQALSPAPANDNIRPRNARLEIQDSTATDDEAEYLPTQSPSSKHKGAPSTPLKRSDIVRSSQTPETLSPSSRKNHGNAVDLRSPLRERSINIPTIQPATPMSDHKSMPAPRASHIASIVSSKLSNKRRSKTKARVEDSQANVWSMPETSSPRKEQPTQLPLASKPQEQTPALRRFLSVNDSSERLEIPATSQVVGMYGSPAAFESNESLPSLGELTGRAGPLPKLFEQQENAVNKELEAKVEVLVRDFARPTTPTKEDRHHSKPIEQQGAGKPIDERVNEVEDSASDFGSPIANDTQFNFDIEHRTSSPYTSQAQSSKSDPSLHDTQRLSDALRQQADDDTETVPLEHTTELFVATPRLVRRSSPEPATSNMPRNNSSTEELLLPPGPSKALSTTQVTTTRVPLNDIQSEAHPSSSPTLPSNKSITQRSIHPASMPHPSQISTQEGTQAYFGQSSMILGEEIETPRGDQKITIKDSSSIRMPLSQIPSHRAWQSQANVDLGLDDLDEDDEYDLDPLSSDSQPPLDPIRKAKLPVKAVEPSIDAAAASEPVLADPESMTDDKDAEPSPSRIQPSQIRNAADLPSSPSSQNTLPLYSPLKGQYSPIPGFNNETQSNFTQNGHVTAAYIHRQREDGALPKWYTPKPYQVPGYTRR